MARTARRDASVAAAIQGTRLAASVTTSVVTIMPTLARPSADSEVAPPEWSSSALMVVAGCARAVGGGAVGAVDLKEEGTSQSQNPALRAVHRVCEGERNADYRVRTLHHNISLTTHLSLLSLPSPCNRPPFRSLRYCPPLLLLLKTIMMMISRTLNEGVAE